jgi:ubiquinone biosynthesis protein UbiJ
MTDEAIFELAARAGITPWVRHAWSKDQFIHTEEGMDGDAACLLQFARLLLNRPWNTIEDDEYQTILGQLGDGGLLAFYILIEEKLREKNT